MENKHFIRTIIENDLKSGKHERPITRFPPEPNGFLHLGHARAIIMNHNLAKDYRGTFNLRFDDTNPLTEDALFVEGMKEDIAWLGCHWDNLFFASDYFEEMYERAMVLVKKGKAYVCDLSAEDIKATRGDLTTPGTDSPYRDRRVEENIRLFEAMRAGAFEDGACVLRAKIDMASPNMNMRDPVIYRIQHSSHHNTKDAWCIYPMYDFAHPLEDAIEGITHSLCTLEFEDHRPIYDWYVEHCEMPKVPRQIEFGKLIIAHQVTGKRFIRQLVEAGVVDGWDDPRLITLSGLRRRGVPPEAIHRFVQALGLPKTEGETDVEMFNEYVRDVMHATAPRIHAVLDPLKVVITNYEGDVETVMNAPFHKDDETFGARPVHFGRELYIERSDFLPDKPDKHWKRLSLGLEVRLMHAYFIRAESFDTDDRGQVETVYCTYDKRTKSGSGFKERKPNGTIHFLEATSAKTATFHLFENLVDPDKDDSLPLEARLNPHSKQAFSGFVEAGVPFEEGDAFQFTRNGYFAVDRDASEDRPVFNRVVALKSSFKAPGRKKRT